METLPTTALHCLALAKGGMKMSVGNLIQAELDSAPERIPIDQCDAKPVVGGVRTAG